MPKPRHAVSRWKHFCCDTKPLSERTTRCTVRNTTAVICIVWKTVLFQWTSWSGARLMHVSVRELGNHCCHGSVEPRCVADMGMTWMKDRQGSLIVLLFLLRPLPVLSCYCIEFSDLTVGHLFFSVFFIVLLILGELSLHLLCFVWWLEVGQHDYLSNRSTNLCVSAAHLAHAVHMVLPVQTCAGVLHTPVGRSVYHDRSWTPIVPLLIVFDTHSGS